MRKDRKERLLEVSCLQPLAEGCAKVGSTRHLESQARDDLALLEVGSDMSAVRVLPHYIYIPWQCHVFRDHVWRFLRRAVIHRLAAVSKAWRYLVRAALAIGWS